MKKLLLTPLLTAFCFSLFAQTQTSEEEYNYLTKGYKIQVESGLDTKDGYALEDITSSSISKYDFQAKRLIRKKKSELAAILIIVKSNVSGKTYYRCIPLNNNELKGRFYNSIRTFDRSLSQALVLFTSDLLVIEVN